MARPVQIDPIMFIKSETAKLLADETPTVSLRSGLVVKAKADRDGRLWAVTYANVTQAKKAAEKLGAGWQVYGLHPFYVGRVKTAPGKN
jgi:hypothetical protein